MTNHSQPAAGCYCPPSSTNVAIEPVGQVPCGGAQGQNGEMRYGPPPPPPVYRRPPNQRMCNHCKRKGKKRCSIQ
ncbi:GH17801 [Drosophila grimshawi]|uniref:GH17801 n=1 Tax=Drosophila grimshawi TaxID=7222 RepID=B4JSN1_DROGR|nr:GH17801 [Drosophila grimshawi]